MWKGLKIEEEEKDMNLDTLIDRLYEKGLSEEECDRRIEIVNHKIWKEDMEHLIN